MILPQNASRVKVTNEGNVIPWLLAAKTMVHNGCTTGLEAYALGVPAISYLATFNEYYDYEFQGLPTKLSYQSFNFEELQNTLAGILEGELGVAGVRNARHLSIIIWRPKMGVWLASVLSTSWRTAATVESSRLQAPSEHMPGGGRSPS